MMRRSAKKVTVALLLAVVLPGISQAADLVAKGEFKKRFTRALSIANELLQESDPPRYKFLSAELELSLMREGGLAGDLKLPILPITPEGVIEYRNMTTIKEKFTYMPRSAIQIGEDDDFGMIQFVKQIQKDLRVSQLESNVVMTRAEREENFVVKYTAEGKISFFNVVSLGGDGSEKNIHKVTFRFCLENQAGECVGP